MDEIESVDWKDNRLFPETELHTHINAILSGEGFIDFIVAIEQLVAIEQQIDIALEDMAITIEAKGPKGNITQLEIPLFEKENGKVKIDPKTNQPKKILLP